MPLESYQLPAEVFVMAYDHAKPNADPQINWHFWWEYWQCFWTIFFVGIQASLQWMAAIVQRARVSIWVMDKVRKLCIAGKREDGTDNGEGTLPTHP